MRRSGNLVHNKTTPTYESTQYGPYIGTQDEGDALWNKIDIITGVIALSGKYAKENVLSKSQRFPWHDNRRVLL